ncbi:MAG: hypothetical protein PVG07_00250 [Acidobacteriota bacterium]|jgi:hypothetical protein
MGKLWRVSLAAIIAGLITFALGSASGLNSWVSTRIQRTWFLPGYEVLFPVLLFVSAGGILLWSRRAGWKPLPTVVLGMAAGQVSGALSYLLSPLFGRGFTLSACLEAVASFERLMGVCALAVAIPGILLAWLYGGIVTAIGLLGLKWLDPHLKDPQ